MLPESKLFITTILKFSLLFQIVKGRVLQYQRRNAEQLRKISIVVTQFRFIQKFRFWNLWYIPFLILQQSFSEAVSTSSSKPRSRSFYIIFVYITSSPRLLIIEAGSAWTQIAKSSRQILLSKYLGSLVSKSFLTYKRIINTFYRLVSTAPNSFLTDSARPKCLQRLQLKHLRYRLTSVFLISGSKMLQASTGHVLLIVMALSGPVSPPMQCHSQMQAKATDAIWQSVPLWFSSLIRSYLLGSFKSCRNLLRSIGSYDFVNGIPSISKFKPMTDEISSSLSSRSKRQLSASKSQLISWVSSSCLSLVLTCWGLKPKSQQASSSRSLNTFSQLLLNPQLYYLMAYPLQYCIPLLSPSPLSSITSISTFWSFFYFCFSILLEDKLLLASISFFLDVAINFVRISRSWNSVPGTCFQSHTASRCFSQSQRALAGSYTSLSRLTGICSNEIERRQGFRQNLKVSGVMQNSALLTFKQGTLMVTIRCFQSCVSLNQGTIIEVEQGIQLIVVVVRAKTKILYQIAVQVYSGSLQITFQCKQIYFEDGHQKKQQQNKKSSSVREICL